jgi:ubiquinone/menaquinone biosynthesis C-methylase UbiE
MRLIQILLRPLYSLLYHQFAWAYDFVAGVVSLGHWRDWIMAALPHLKGRVLEIGYGPGHLQLELNKNRIVCFGLDESRQMARQASRRVRNQGAICRLTRGYAQNLPFASESFNSVTATFPAEFIFDFLTLNEIRRILTPSGKLVILPMAWITGKSLMERLASWFFRVSGEAPGKPKPISTALHDRFTQAGFDSRSEIAEMSGGQVLVILAEKR